MLIYEDTTDFQFNEAEHKYTVSFKVNDDKKDVWTTPRPVVGVTTICNIISKDALIGWSAKVASDYIKKNLKDIKDVVKVSDEAKREYINISKKGKETGTIGHELIEKLLKGDEPTPPEDKFLLKEYSSIKNAFEEWRDDFQPEPMTIEQAVYCKTHDFAGTFDLLCNINDKITLIDFKTTKTSYYNPDGIYASNFAQLGAYMLGLEEMLGCL